MGTTSKPFLALTAADLMTTPVLTLPAETSLREAGRLLSQSNISGAPVVDTDGRCLGVLSSSDFVTWVGEGGEPGKEAETISFIAPWGEVIKIEDSPDDEIRHYMTTPPVTIPTETCIGELAQKMVDAHIHRVLVVLDQHRPCGIVTSTDILAAVARAACETPRPRARKRRRSSSPPPGSVEPVR